MTALVLWGAIEMMPIIPGLIVREFFDGIESDPGFDPTSLITLILVYGAARIVALFLGNHNDADFMIHTGHLMRRNMLERVFALPAAQAMHVSTGEMITRFREDVEHTEDAVSWTVDMLGSVAFVLVAGALLMRTDARMTLFVFAPLVIVVAVTERAGTRIRRNRAMAREATGRVTETLAETFGMVQSIKVAGAENTILRHFAELNDARRKVMVRDRVLTAGLESVVRNTLSVGTALILLFAAGRMSSGAMSLGDFALFVYFLDFVTERLFWIGVFIARFRQAGVSIERMIDLMKGAPPEDLSRRRSLHLTGQLPVPPQPQVTVGDDLHVLSAEGLSFRYPGTDNGICDLSFTIQRGTFTVVTGRVGAGKSTLLRVLLGLVEADAGQIRWNGELVTDPGSFFTPPRSAYLPQVPRLFSMSLRDNLLLGLDEPEESLLEGVRIAALDKDLEAMSDGLSTLVGPRGVRLSGGQVQRAAVARVLVRRPELLVLDDLSSSLDLETEHMLWRRLLGGRAVTALVVSHRAPTLRYADQILVMDGGSIVAVGDYRSLTAGGALELLNDAPAPKGASPPWSGDDQMVPPPGS